MIGPVFLVLIELALNKGVKKALTFDAGVILADSLFVVLIWFGADFIEIQKHAIWVYGIGGLLIILFGVYNVYSAHTKKANLDWKPTENSKNSSYEMLLAKGFLMNFLNMGVLGYWLATSLVMKANVKGDNTLLFYYFLTTILAYFFTDVAKVLFAKNLRKKLTPALLVNIEKTVGIILIGFGILMIARGYLNHMGYSIQDYLNEL